MFFYLSFLILFTLHFSLENNENESLQIKKNIVHNSFVTARMLILNVWASLIFGPKKVSTMITTATGF